MAIDLKNRVQELRFNWPIVDPNSGFPNPQFIRLFQSILGNEQGIADSTPANIDDLDDVNAGSPADGEVLTYDAASGEWKPTAGGGMSHQQVMARASIGV